MAFLNQGTHDYSNSLLKSVSYKNEAARRIYGALTLSEKRSETGDRIKRILTPSRRIVPRLSCLALLGLGIVALVVLPNKGNQPPQQPIPRIEVGDNEICQRGDKFIAIRQAYQHPSGWIAFKIETNLAAPFDCVYRPEAYAYCRSSDNLTKWGFDNNEWMLLHHCMWQGVATNHQGVLYPQEPRNKRALIHFNTERETKTQWRICYPDDGFLGKHYATRLSFRALCNVRNCMQDQSPADYIDWKNDPEMFQMFNTTFQIPTASEDCPDEIKADMKAIIEKVERQMLLHRIPRLENAQAVESALDQFRSRPKKERMRENLSWLGCLAKHGRIEEAQAFLQEFRAYVEEVDQDDKKQFKSVLLPQAERHFKRLFGSEKQSRQQSQRLRFPPPADPVLETYVKNTVRTHPTIAPPINGTGHTMPIIKPDPTVNHTIRFVNPIADQNAVVIIPEIPKTLGEPSDPDKIKIKDKQEKP